MPVMDGIEATREIRRLERSKRLANAAETASKAPNSFEMSLIGSDVVIVALTASSLPADRDAALSAGCNDYLIKPVSLGRCPISPFSFFLFSFLPTPNQGNKPSIFFF